MAGSNLIGGLVVYSGDTMRASKAKVIKVGAAETNHEADITIPLSSLHTIHGYVTLKSSGQPPPMAVLQLLYADTKEPARVAIAQNGEFQMSYVPEESFIVRAVASAQALPNLDPEEDSANGIGFVTGGVRLNAKGDEMPEGAVEIPLLVKGDVAGITIALPDPPAKEPSQPAPAPDQSDTDAQVVSPPQQ